MRGRRGHAVAMCLALLAGACSSGGGAEHASGRSRTTDVEMVDTAFRPTVLTVERGETVTFRFRNTGAARHEALVGDRKAQQEHEAGMADGHGHHMATGALTVAPGANGELTHTFDSAAGTVEIGCHEPGHWAAGMRITVRVT